MRVNAETERNRKAFLKILNTCSGSPSVQIEFNYHGMLHLRDLAVNKLYGSVLFMTTRWRYWCHDSVCGADSHGKPVYQVSFH